MNVSDDPMIKSFYPPISTLTFYLVREESVFSWHSSLSTDKLWLMVLLIRWEVRGFGLLDSAE